MQASPSPTSRVFRLHRQYISTQNSPVSPAVRQVQLQGQRSLPGWQVQPQRQSRRGPALRARLQA